MPIEGRLVGGIGSVRHNNQIMSGEQAGFILLEPLLKMTMKTRGFRTPTIVFMENGPHRFLRVVFRNMRTDGP